MNIGDVYIDQRSRFKGTELKILTIENGFVEGEILKSCGRYAPKIGYITNHMKVSMIKNKFKKKESTHINVISTEYNI